MLKLVKLLLLTKFFSLVAKNVKVGSPVVEGATVTAKVEKQGRAKKNHRFQIQSEKRTIVRNKVIVNLTLS